MIEINTHPGRPVKYTPDQLWDKFCDYKASQQGHTRKVYDAKLKTVVELEYDKPVILTGFCVYAGIHRDTLNEYKNNREEFSDVIKDIYAECEMDLLEKALIFQQHAGFSEHILNNAHGYAKKSELVIENKDQAYSTIELEQKIKEIMGAK